MILAASLEFEKKHNSEVVERPTDNEEVPHVSITVVLWLTETFVANKNIIIEHDYQGSYCEKVI